MTLPDRSQLDPDRVPATRKGAGKELTQLTQALSVSSVSAPSGPFWESHDLIHAYTRAQALADGVLVDVSDQAGSGPDGMLRSSFAGPAKLGGFSCPVAVTVALWQAIEAIPPSLVGIADPRGRLHDVLWMAAVSLRTGKARLASTGGFLSFRVILPYRGTRKRAQTLTLHVGPDDDGERPCVTLGFPEDF